MNADCKHSVVRPSSLTRRGFLAGSCLAASALRAPSARANPQSGIRNPKSVSPGVTEIDPGYVGPQFFDEREHQALEEVLESGSPFRYWGPGRPEKVQRFEDQYAKYMGTRFALGVTSGTTALDCAVAGLGLGPGDEVIVPAYTWWSDYTCVVHAGALPVFADIDRTFNLDPADFERRITPRTKAVIAVHLLGGPCDLDPILEIAHRHKIAVLEDAAQCVGGSYHSRKLGALGDVGIYSFQINKMITSGEGGAVVTSDPLIYERAVRFHDMGTIRSPFTDRLGSTQVPVSAGENFRMNELTGAVLGAQLTKLDAMIAQLRGHAEAVYEGIKTVEGIRLRQRPDPAGDIGYCVGFEMKDKATRDHCLQELRRRKIPASTLTGSVLLPIQESVIQKRARHPNWPSFNSPEGKAIQYGPDTCRQTLGIFDRFVQVRMGARYTQRIDDYIIDAIRQVHGMLAWSWKGTHVMIELLRARRSIRSFTGQAIEPEKVDVLKEAVLRSPSSRNLDPWEFLFVADRAVLEKLARCKPHGADFLAEAALGIVVCGDSNESDTWIEDGTIASILVQMTALSLGLGSCWVQVRNRMFDDQTTSEQYLQGLLGIPEHLKVECVVAVGYPAQKREPLARGSLKYAKIHTNTYRG